MFESIRQHKTTYIIESVLFILLGMMAIIFPGIFTISFELLIGIAFLIGGIVQTIRTIKTKEEPNWWLSLITGILSFFVGIYLLINPLHGVLAITLVIAALFFVEGIIKIIIGLSESALPNRGWIIFSGVISFLLSILIWYELPFSAVWLLGILIGINFLIFGISLLAVTLQIGKVNN